MCEMSFAEKFTEAIFDSDRIDDRFLLIRLHNTYLSECHLPVALMPCQIRDNTKWTEHGK